MAVEAEARIDAAFQHVIEHEIEGGKFKLNSPSAALVDKAKRRPIEDYVKTQGRFSQLKPNDVEELKRWIDETWENYKRQQLNV